MPALMIVNFNSYDEIFNSGVFPMAYKIPNQKEAIEAVKTEMPLGDTKAIFFFKKLIAKKLLQSGDKGNLIVWIPPSFDGEVNGSDNIYFSLDGFSSAYKEVTRLCRYNK